jgi:cytochrome c oxidase assembly protein subunit 11
MTRREVQAANLRAVRKLLLVTVGMFGFAFLMWPLYTVFCEITGLQGKTSNERASVEGIQVDESRLVTVEFVASLNAGMPWNFRPAVTSMQVHPGKTYKTSYYAENQSPRTMVGQAVPSVAPGTAARHFKKTECFCFTEQKFEPGEGRDMPLLFMIDPDLPEDVVRVTLSYTFFEKAGA